MYTGKLKKFQIEAAKFLTDKKKALCAYDVGLGKTHIALASAEKIHEYRIEQLKVLVVCPNYVKKKWGREIETWTDSEHIIIEGTPKQREELYHQIPRAGYVIVNYELLLQDFKILREIPFSIVIADEITRIKNFRSKTKTIFKNFRSEYRWGLTGTPIGNKPDELFSIMEWIEPNLFGRWYSFEDRYIRRGRFREIVAYVNLEDLADKSSARMISKLQEEVEEELPEVYIENLLINPTPKQEKIYKVIADSLEDNLDTMVEKLFTGVPSGKEEALIRKRFSALRQACVSPLLLGEGESLYAKDLAKSYFLDEGAKIPALLDLLDELIQSPKDKVVVFSFYRHVVDLISEKLKFGHCVVKGGMGINYVAEEIDKFNYNTEKVVIITTDAIEKGIDLQKARYLVNMDVPFSWEKYNQRMGRVKRLGSPHKNVGIYNLLIAGSFEERQAMILEAKKDLAMAAAGKIRRNEIIPSKVSLRTFLKLNEPFAEV